MKSLLVALGCLISVLSYSQTEVASPVVEGKLIPLTEPHGHGIWLSAAKGETYSIVDGEVLSAFSADGEMMILIKTADKVIIYGNLEKTNLVKGDHVSKGDKIGALSSKYRQPYVLHFQAWKLFDKDKTAPLTYQETKDFVGYKGL